MNNEQQDEEIVPTIDFEYDATWTGGESDGEEGNYIDKAGAIVQVPLSLIESSDEKTAFETFTGLSRVHIVHWDSEESEACGDEVGQESLDAIQKELQTFSKEHAKTCEFCAILVKG